ncbi:MAG: hypothetical protein KC910_33620 [Candidatus Eremiobacteraeota bacterium]|nr:hypothetical protein [Candidatus Eremiobacteraeota bacterium]
MSVKPFAPGSGRLSKPGEGVIVAPFSDAIGILADDFLLESIVGALPPGWTTRQFGEFLVRVELAREADGFVVKVNRIVKAKASHLESALDCLLDQLRHLVVLLEHPRLFVKARLMRHREAAIVVLGASGAEVGPSEGSAVAFDVNGRVTTLEAPGDPLEVVALVELDPSSGAPSQDLGAARMAASVFEAKLTPLREVGPWLDVIGDLAQASLCLRMQPTQEAFELLMQRLN